MRRQKITTIISGGQTGADRAAFDFALENGIEIGGFVPQGRRAEDGRIGERYPHLIETKTRNYSERTRLNIEHSDATLILSNEKLTGGSRLTERLAERRRKPCLHLEFSSVEMDDAVESAKKWLDSVDCRKLNVAGPRASTDPEIYEKTKTFLARLFSLTETKETKEKRRS
jgi:hypothetical protein